MSKTDNTKRMALISAEAKKLYKEGKSKGMKWTGAIVKASEKLKKEGKI